MIVSVPPSTVGVLPDCRLSGDLSSNHSESGLRTAHTNFLAGFYLHNFPVVNHHLDRTIFNTGYGPENLLFDIRGDVPASLPWQKVFFFRVSNFHIPGYFGCI
jgi:hypothetical protein